MFNNSFVEMIPKTECESQCLNQILNYHFNTNFIPMFIVFFFALSYQVISNNKEWIKGKYIESGNNPDLVDGMEFVAGQMTYIAPVIYFIWYYLHFILKWAI